MDLECSLSDSPSSFPSRPVALPDELRGALLLPSECPSEDLSHHTSAFSPRSTGRNLGSSPEVRELLEQVPTNRACSFCGAISFFDKHTIATKQSSQQTAQSVMQQSPLEKETQQVARQLDFTGATSSPRLCSQSNNAPL